MVNRLILSTLLLVAFIPISTAFPIGWPFIIFGPETPTLAFKGQVTENGKAVPAYLSLEVLYKVNNKLVPVSLVQVNSLSNYELRLSGIIFANPNITNTAILRAQSLSAYGGSNAIEIQLKDHKILYEHDIELGHRRNQYREEKVAVY